MLHNNSVGKRAFDCGDNGDQRASLRDRSCANCVSIVIVLGNRCDASICHGQMIKPPCGRSIKGLFADHDIVDASLRVILKQLREVIVFGKNFDDFSHMRGGKRTTNHHRSIACVVHQRAARGDRVTRVIDEVEDVTALAKGPAGGGDDFDARVLQSSNCSQIRVTHAALAIEQRSIEIGYEQFVAHTSMVTRARCSAVFTITE